MLHGLWLPEITIRQGQAGYGQVVLGTVGEEVTPRVIPFRLLLSLAAFLTRFTHTRMPIFVLSMCVAEPPFASRAVHRCRITARLIIGRHALTQALEVGAFLFVEFFEHRYT